MDAIPFAPRRRFFFAAPAPAREPGASAPQKNSGRVERTFAWCLFLLFGISCLVRVPPDCGLAENRPPVVLISGGARLALPGRPEHHLGAIAPVCGRCAASFAGIFALRSKKPRQKPKTAANPTLTIRAPPKTNVRDLAACALSSPGAATGQHPDRMGTEFLCYH